MNASGKTETKILVFHDYGTFKSVKLATLTLSAYEVGIDPGLPFEEKVKLYHMQVLD